MLRREYKLKINGEIDFIVISPKVLSSLIAQIRSGSEREVVVSIDDIMPWGFADYLLRVINSNRFTNERFRYRYILENPVTRKGLYEILRQQLSNADIEKSPCFQNIRLTDTFRGDAGLDMECNELFFWACKDTTAKFIYMFPYGQQETLVIEY